MQEAWLFPFVKIRLGIEGKCCNVLTWSANVFLVLFRLQIPIPIQDGETLFPLPLLLQVLRLLVDTQPPIFSTPQRIHLMKTGTRFLLVPEQISLEFPKLVEMVNRTKDNSNTKDSHTSNYGKSGP